MKCCEHAGAEAVAICVNCGKGICLECAGKSASGRQVCSAACAASATARPLQIHRYVLYSLGFLLVLAAHYYYYQDLWQISVFLAFAAFLCFFRGRWGQRKYEGLTHMDYCTGDALEKAHRLRKLLSELLDLHAKITASPITLAQIDAGTEQERYQILARIYSDISQKTSQDYFAKEQGGMPHEIVDRHQPKTVWLARDTIEAQAKRHAKDIGFCQHLAEDYFAEASSQSKPRFNALRQDVYSQHLSLRDYVFWLGKLNRDLAAHLQTGGKS